MAVIFLTNFHDKTEAEKIENFLIVWLIIMNTYNLNFMQILPSFGIRTRGF